MQPQPIHPASLPPLQAAAVARPSQEPLSDWEVLALLGGVYLGGLGTIVGTLYAVSFLL